MCKHSINKSDLSSKLELLETKLMVYELDKRLTELEDALIEALEHKEEGCPCNDYEENKEEYLDEDDDTDECGCSHE